MRQATVVHGSRGGDSGTLFGWGASHVELQKVERRAPAGAAALQWLMVGNDRFAHDVRSVDVLPAPLRRQALVEEYSLETGEVRLLE